jgi:hypothetical protein
VGSGLGRRILVVAHDIAQQDHARPPAALRLGGVADGFHVALVEVLEPREDRLRMAVEVVLDLDDRRHRALHVAEELEAHGANVLRHAVQDEGRRGDEPVAAFLLDPRQPREELVGDVLAEPFLAQPPAFDLEQLFALHGPAVGFEAAQAKACERRIVDAPAVVVEPLDLEPFGLGRDHPPRGEVVERRAPEDRFLAARVHRDVAADARGIRRGGIDREHEARFLGRLHHAARDHAGAAADDGARFREARQHARLDRPERFELLGVHHRREPVERNGAPGVAGAAAARNDREAQLDQGAHDARAFLLGVGVHHDEGILDPPVGGVGHVGDARHPVELDVVLARDRAQAPHDLAPQRARFGEFLLERLHRLARRNQQAAHARIAIGVALVAAPAVDVVQALVHRLHQQREAPRAVEEVVLQVRIAAHHPDVAQDFVEHARRAPGDAFAAQLLERAPRGLAQQADHDLPVRIGGVVVGDLAEACGHDLGRGLRNLTAVQHLSLPGVGFQVPCQTLRNEFGSPRARASWRSRRPGSWPKRCARAIPASTSSWCP